jgi:two-component system chemotaxis response regulator CheY
MTTRILIVDDNLMMRQMLSTQLGTMGYTNVSKAVNGLDAMDQLIESHEKGDPFHIVLLDWNMPEMDGLDFLRVCRGDKRFTQTAIVMIAAEGEQQNIVKALEIGATSYLVKPYAPDAFEEKIKQVLEWRKTAPASSGKATHA